MQKRWILHLRRLGSMFVVLLLILSGVATHTKGEVQKYYEESKRQEKIEEQQKQKQQEGWWEQKKAYDGAMKAIENHTLDRINWKGVFSPKEETTSAMDEPDEHGLKEGESKEGVPVDETDNSEQDRGTVQPME